MPLIPVTKVVRRSRKRSQLAKILGAKSKNQGPLSAGDMYRKRFLSCDSGFDMEGFRKRFIADDRKVPKKEKLQAKK